MADEIRAYFQAEAGELVDRLTQGASQLGPAGAPAEAVSGMLRAAHTLKGAAQVVGETGIARQAHAFEELLGMYKVHPTAAVAAEALRLADAMAEALREAFRPAEPTAVAVSAASLSPPPPPEPDPQSGPESGLNLGPESGSAPPASSGLAAADDAALRTIRVDLRESERLLTQIHAGTAAAASVRELLGEREETGGAVEPAVLAYRRALRDRLDWLDRALAELYRTASRLRLHPTETLMLEAGRVSRSAARALGREVVCQTRADADRLDLHVLEALEEALLHLVRNSVAHGIETPAERRAAGKPAAGTVQVELAREGRSVVLRCTDDGRGIDLAAVRRAAVRRGVLLPEAAEAAAPETLYGLLLGSGFSTRQAADQVSGRGIGLDAVQSAARRLGGSVTIASRPGQGSTFTVTVPETAFSTEVLTVEAGGIGYAVPLAGVEQTLVLGAHHKVSGSKSIGLFLKEGLEQGPRDQGSGPVQNQGQRPSQQSRLSPEPWTPTPLLPMASLGGLMGARAVEGQVALVLRAGGERAVLAVDRIELIAEALVRPLPALLRPSPLLAGVILSATGEPQLVLDVQATVDAVVRSHSAGRLTPSREESTAQQAERLPVLVIDDSLTTRMLERSILEAEGYLVEFATSAEQALDMVHTRAYALLLVDVEMPGMNGFEFVRTVRADPALSGTPAILVTSLDSAEHRAQGMATGAYSYIVKGEFNQKVYLDRIRSAVGGRG